MTKQQKEKPEPIVYQEYTSKDFFDLDREFEKYKETVSLPVKFGSEEREDCTFVTTKGLQRWYIDNGALSNKEEWTICNIPKYKELQNKLEQYDNWQRKKEYAIKMDLKEKEKMVEQIQIKDIPNVEYYKD